MDKKSSWPGALPLNAERTTATTGMKVAQNDAVKMGKRLWGEFESGFDTFEPARWKKKTLATIGRGTATVSTPLWERLGIQGEWTARCGREGNKKDTNEGERRY